MCVCSMGIYRSCSPFHCVVASRRSKHHFVTLPGLGVDIVLGELTHIYTWIHAHTYARAHLGTHTHTPIHLRKRLVSSSGVTQAHTH